jgi:hypothetical protein
MPEKKAYLPSHKAMKEEMDAHTLPESCFLWSDRDEYAGVDS